MQKMFFLIIALYLTLCASVAGAQVVVNNFPLDEKVLYGSQEVNHGEIEFITNGDALEISTMSFEVRSCSALLLQGLPMSNFKLSTEENVFLGTVSTINGEPVVSFNIGKIQAPQTEVRYKISSNTVPTSSTQESKQCLRLVLKRTGILTKSQLSENFPIWLGAKTIVLPKGARAANFFKNLIPK